VLRDLAARGGDIVSAITGRATIVNRNKALLARPQWWLCDSSLARQELGWKSEVPLLDGLRETYNSYVEARWLKPPKTGTRGPEQATTEELTT
jgi:nucleoside-diphosphate-sugar epimerase